MARDTPAGHGKTGPEQVECGVLCKTQPGSAGNRTRAASDLHPEEGRPALTETIRHRAPDVKPPRRTDPDLLAALVDYLRAQAEHEAVGSRDFGRGFSHAVKVLADFPHGAA